MKNGFYNELDELRREDADADFGFLENVDITDTLNAFRFLHGFCADFAAVLSDLYGYEIIALRHCDDDNISGKLIHAYCIAQIEGESAFIDVRGITTDPVLFFEEFENEMTYSPEDDELWDLEGPVTIERWPNKDSLFDGEYEGWTDNEIREFIIMNADYYSPRALKKLIDSITSSFKDPNIPIEGSGKPTLQKLIASANLRTSVFTPPECTIAVSRRSTHRR